jgi:hypothetical protein
MSNLSQKRFWFTVLTTYLAAIAVSTEAFILTHLDHDCTGESCPTCARIEVAQRLMERLGRIAVAAFLAFCVADCVKLLVKSSAALLLPPITPVSLKIKINS